MRAGAAMEEAAAIAFVAARGKLSRRCWEGFMGGTAPTQVTPGSEFRTWARPMGVLACPRDNRRRLFRRILEAPPADRPLRRYTGRRQPMRARKTARIAKPGRAGNGTDRARRDS